MGLGQGHAKGKQNKNRNATNCTNNWSKQQRVEFNASWLTNFCLAKVAHSVLFAFTVQNCFPLANCKEIPHKLYFDQLIFLFFFFSKNHYILIISSEQIYFISYYLSPPPFG